VAIVLRDLFSSNVNALEQTIDTAARVEVEFPTQAQFLDNQGKPLTLRTAPFKMLLNNAISNAANTFIEACDVGDALEEGARDGNHSLQHAPSFLLEKHLYDGIYHALGSVPVRRKSSDETSRL